jgi:hypothetical protein
MNFDNYQFRPSQLPDLMRSGKKAGTLSKTTQSILDKIFIKEKYGREEIIVSKYMEKGTSKEDKSIELYSIATDPTIKLEKNQDRLQNEYLIGTPDLILEDKVVDIKTSWSIWTYFAVDEAKAKEDYYYQLVAYMLLTGKKKAELAYCLVDNEEFTIYSELRKIQFGLGLDELNDMDKIAELEAQVRYNHTYGDIPISERVKIFHFELLEDEEEKIKAQLDLCKQYLNSLN